MVHVTHVIHSGNIRIEIQETLGGVIATVSRSSVQGSLTILYRRHKERRRVTDRSDYGMPFGKKYSYLYIHVNTV